MQNMSNVLIDANACPRIFISGIGIENVFWKATKICAKVLLDCGSNCFEKEDLVLSGARFGM
jgi:hypothetical protein